MAFRKSTKPFLLRKSLLATTGFAAGLSTVAAAALSGGEAKALTSCPFAGIFTGPTPCAIGTPYQEGDKTLTFLTAPPFVGSGTMDWQEVTSGVWQLDTDYTPIDVPGPANALVEYQIDITNPNTWFSNFQVDTGVIASTNTTTLFVEIFSDAAFTNLVASATSTDGSNTGFVNIPG
jgi:hypothetical protein